MYSNEVKALFIILLRNAFIFSNVVCNCKHSLFATAYPDFISPRIVTSYANIGSTARLDCSVLPGKLVGVYFVTWRNASNTSIEFFKILPQRSPQTNSTFNSRYSIDYNNFSLYIQDVQLVDGDIPYQCVLGVADPFINPLGQVPTFIYNQTKTANISLSISEYDV